MLRQFKLLGLKPSSRFYPTLSSFQVASNQFNPLRQNSGEFILSSSFSTTSHSQFSPTTTKEKPFLLADIGEGIVEVEIVKWLIQKGQKVEEFDPLVEVMSDKATVEITSPFSGTILSLGGNEGERVRVGEVLCEVEIDKDLDHMTEIATDLPPISILAEVASVIKPPPLIIAPEIIQSREVELEKEDIRASPSTRRLAREHGIQLGQVQGSGKEGRVTKSDILDFISLPPSILPPATPTSTISTSPVTTYTATESTSIISLSPLRRAMFKAMTSTLSIPHFSYSETIDVTDLERLRHTLNSSIPLHYRKTLSAKEEMDLDRQVDLSGSERVEDSRRIEKITLLPLLIRALSKALETNRLFLSTLSPSLDSLQIRQDHDVSIALSPPQGGLFTPVLKSVQSLSIFEIASQISQLQSISLESSPPKFPVEFKGSGSITISNVGVIGGRFTTPIIPPTGQLAILAIGKTRVVPTYSNDSLTVARKMAIEGGMKEEEKLEIVPRLMLDVSFSADHRVVEGIELARLVEAWKQLIENPGRLI